MADWPLRPLGELVEIYDGPHSTPTKTIEGPLFLGIECLRNGRLELARAAHLSEADFLRWTRRVTPRIGDVVFSYETRLGEAALVPAGIQCCLGRRMGLLRPRVGRIDPRFLLYAFLSPQFQEEVRMRTVHGSTVDRIPLTELTRFPLAVPVLGEQKAIARLLGALDDKIDLNQRISASIETLARALFTRGFGPLDPATPADGWTVAALGEHVDVVRGLSYSGSGLSEDGVPLHNLDSIYEGGGYKYEGIKHYRGEYKDRHVARAGDVLVANTEQGFEHLLVGYPAVVPKRFGELSLFSADLFLVRPRPGSSITNRFLYLALMSPRLRQVIIGYSNGTTVNHLPSDALQRPRLAIPPADVVARFDELVAPLFAKQEQLQLENETLARLRDLLLPKLMSGEIRLKPEAAAESEASIPA